MKIFYTSLILVAILFLVGFWFLIRYTISCQQYAVNYYWVSWAGSYYDTGTTDVDIAQKIANGRPITIPRICIKK